MAVDWKPLIRIVDEFDRFVLTSHVRPDCDALGSELGMAQVLDAKGKDVLVVNDHDTPDNLRFIDPANRIRTLEAQRAAGGLDDRQVLMVLDTSAWAQLGAMADVVRSFPGQVVVVDHHVGEDDMPGLMLKDTSAEACGRLVAEAAGAIGVDITPEIAMPLFAAVATDTGWFRFRSVSAATYHLAAALIEAGADPAAIYRDLYEQDTAGRIKLRGIILSRIATELDGRLIHTYVRDRDFQEVGAVAADTEDVVNMTLAVAGTEVAVIFVEQPSGHVKISFRSRGMLDCNRLATSFGGGGHKAAAGAMLPGPFEAAREKVLQAVREAMQGSN